MSDKIIGRLYRYDTLIIHRYNGYREFEIKCQEYKIIDKTEKGVWILIHHAGEYYLRSGKAIPKRYKKFVLDWYKGARRRWAYPDKELAYKSYCIRKQRQLEHLENQILNCTRVNKMIADNETTGRIAVPTRYDVWAEM